MRNRNSKELEVAKRSIDSIAASESTDEMDFRLELAKANALISIADTLELVLGKLEDIDNGIRAGRG